MAEWSRPPRVVLADDYDGIRTALTRLLTPVCEVVGHVSDGAELFDVIECLRPDIVILDLNMPGIDGLDACRHIKATAAAVDVIICTAANDTNLRSDALQAGASAFVVKFRVADDLIAAIQRTRSSWPAAARVVTSRVVDSREGHMDEATRVAGHRAAGQLRGVEGRVIGAREQERHRLSRELHDGIGQRLGLLSAELAALREVTAG